MALLFMLQYSEAQEKILTIIIIKAEIFYLYLCQLYQYMLFGVLFIQNNCFMYRNMSLTCICKVDDQDQLY